ncbi:hypothetical protein RHSIM_Rhsim01G0184200 [Rhododendron simsii]|uniref:Uncharacterized protein n=1 Tax=Rhododendron simsii TaxID=118357 RepID=A0A834HQ19_RHOSS|nr:hypothetical protein RHSIM_Rhsim01G0184200 [Rhododendron simsii]
MVMTMMVTNAFAATISECVVGCMPICLKLKDSTEDACENGCTLGCQQLQGKGFHERNDPQKGQKMKKLYLPLAAAPLPVGDKIVKKLYLLLAAAAAPPPDGVITQAIRRVNMAPRILSEGLIFRIPL